MMPAQVMAAAVAVFADRVPQYLHLRDQIVLRQCVVLENRPDPEVVPVSAEVSAQYESLIGHVEVIDMRAVEADGFVSYIGTLDASGQRFFRFVIEAQPAGTDQPLRMNFEVQLDALDIE
jgi:hypothetical protein